LSEQNRGSMQFSCPTSQTRRCLTSSLLMGKIIYSNIYFTFSDTDRALEPSILVIGTGNRLIAKCTASIVLATLQIVALGIPFTFCQLQKITLANHAWPSLDWIFLQQCIPIKFRVFFLFICDGYAKPLETIALSLKRQEKIAAYQSNIVSI
jgi:hypothetical protein